MVPKLPGTYRMEGVEQNDVMRTGHWALPETLSELLRALYPDARTDEEKRTTVSELLRLPVAGSMPDTLRQEIRSTYGL